MSLKPYRLSSLRDKIEEKAEEEKSEIKKEEVIKIKKPKLGRTQGEVVIKRKKK